MSVESVKKSVLITAFLAVVCAFAWLSPTRADEALAQRGRGTASFNHGSKMHRKINCSECHRVSSAQPDVRDFPGHAKCIVCHNFASETVMSFTNYCGICHSGQPVSKAQPRMFDFRMRTRQLQSDFGIDFSHPAHRKPLPPDVIVRQSPASKFRINLNAAPKCDDCHQRLMPRPVNAPEMVIEKGHSTCFQCHGERPPSARVNFPYMNDCGGCHELGGIKGANIFGAVRSFHHADHEFDTRPIRKADYRKRPADYLCSECHATVDRAEKLRDIKLPQEQTCNLCHNGRLGLPDPLEASVLQQLRQ